MYQTKTFKIPTYETKLQFIIAPDAKKTVNRIFKKYNTGMVYPHYIEGMMITVSMNMYHVIIDSRHITYNAINHELFHAVMGITSDRNIFEEEPRAWLMGILSQEIYTFLKEKNVKIA